MAIYVGMTQDLESARKFFIEQKSGMYPEVLMGPFKEKILATNYIKFMQDRFPGAIELKIPKAQSQENSGKWWVFSFEHSGQIH